MLLTILYILCATIWAFIQYKLQDKDNQKLSNNIEIIITNWISNLLFVTIFLNFPTIAIWQYMRKNDFLAPEIFEYNYLYNYIGLDFLILILVAFIIPIVLALSKEKIIKIIGSIFVVIYIIFIVLGMISNPNLVIPTIIFMLSVSLHGYGVYKKANKFIDELKKNKKFPEQKLQFQSLISAITLICLILIPSLTLESFTQHTLQRMKLGGFNVTIRTDDKRVLEGFLLLKTKEFYYIHPKCEDKTFKQDVVIIQTANTTLAYKSKSE